MPKTKTSTIIKSNAQFASHNRQAGQGEHIVCVFAGAMSGIGARMLERMVMVSYHSTVFYVLWKSSEPSNAHRKRVLESILNRGCKIVFIDADVSLISDMDAASEQILAAEEKVDYLCMSKNDIPLDEDTNTSEGVQTALSLWYFSRMRLLSNLLPFLRRSPKPRVLNILNHGAPRPPSKDYGGHGTILQYTNSNGVRRAGNSHGTDAPETTGVFLRAWHTILNVRLEVSEQLFGRRPDKALERHFYYLTSSNCGSGAFHVDEKREIVPSTRPSGPFWESDKNRPDVVWAFTDELWQTALAHNEAN
ncbi:hypothetical protein CHU98_g9443 [Xylaria longipes]|nr:hypothetical protein CHU98_g9443 [Xylaria longipes]